MLLTTCLVLLISAPSASLISLGPILQSQAQPAGPPRLSIGITSAEATELTNGWAMLAEGNAEQAAVRADRVLATNPRSVAAFVLGVEAELARGAAGAALSRYERWIGARPLEEPSVVRRIASGVLRELTGAKQPASARLEALRALAEDGDGAAAAALMQGVKASGVAEARVLAAMGDERAVTVLIADLKRSGGRSMASVEALGASGSKLAVAPLTEHLQHGYPEIRGAAVEGLGKLGAKHKVTSHIKPLLSDPVSFVRVKAAAALFALGDVSGLGILQELASQEAAVSRLMAAQAMASQPGPEWQEQVRRLTSAAEPEVRVGAARLLVPHQPELARTILESAMNDSNPAIRDMASESFVDVVPADLRVLRHLLKSPNAHARGRAASRILALLR